MGQGCSPHEVTTEEKVGKVLAYIVLLLTGFVREYNRDFCGL